MTRSTLTKLDTLPSAAPNPSPSGVTAVPQPVAVRGRQQAPTFTPGLCVCRHGGRRWYSAPDGRLVRYSEAKEAFAKVRSLSQSLDAEMDYARRTGLGDHAKITRLLTALRKARGEQA